MTYFAGLDVSLEWTSVCVVDGDGQIVREAKVLSEPDALVAFFAEPKMDVTRICLEAGPQEGGATSLRPTDFKLRHYPQASCNASGSELRSTGQ